MSDVKWSSFPAVSIATTGDHLVGLRAGVNVQFAPTIAGTGLLFSGNTLNNTFNNAPWVFGVGAQSVAANGGVALGAHSLAWGVASTANFGGSWTIHDDSLSPVLDDTAANQYSAKFAGGFYYYVGATTNILASSIDTLGNVIDSLGQADQSYSYQVPTTGFSITPAAGVRTLVLAPIGTLATGTIVLTSLDPIDGQLFRVYTTKTITALSFTGTVNNAPTTLPAGNGFDLQYNLANTAWNPVYQPSAAGTPSPWTAGSGANSAYGGGATDGGGTNTLAWGPASVVHGNDSFAFGENAVASHNGSWVIGDQFSAPPTDTISNTWNSSFYNGYNFYYSYPSALAVSIDPAGNFITHTGQADQSYSYQVPTTGFNITPAAGVRTLALAPAATLATGTIDLTSLAPIDGQLFRVYSSKTITALTITGSVNNAPTSVTAGQGFDLQYNLANTIWNVVYQNYPIPASSSGTYAPVLVAYANVTGVSAPQPWQYMQVGNVVTVSGVIVCTVTTTLTSTEILASLPVVSSNNFTVEGQAGGSAATYISAGANSLAIIANVSTQQVNIVGIPISTGLTVYSFSFTYLIV